MSDDSRAGSGKAPTMADVAARAGVSKALVSTVFRDVPGASPTTRARVLKAANDLGYRLDNRARMLRRSRTKLMGVTFRVGDAFQSGLVAALYPAAKAAGYDIVLSATLPDRPEADAVASLLDDRCECLLLISPQSDDEELEELGTRLPVVSIARKAPATALEVVRTRDADVIRTALDHLVALEHRRISLVDGAQIHGSADRRRSYRDAMKRRDLGADIDVVLGGNTEAAGQRAARTLVDRGSLPTALVGFNDSCAIGLVFELRRLGVRVPEDVSVVGYDDIRLASLPFVDLTTVGQNTIRTAEAAVSRVVDRLDNHASAGGTTFVDPYFVERGTSAPVS